MASSYFVLFPSTLCYFKSTSGTSDLRVTHGSKPITGTFSCSYFLTYLLVFKPIPVLCGGFRGSVCYLCPETFRLVASQAIWGEENNTARPWSVSRLGFNHVFPGPDTPVCLCCGALADSRATGEEEGSRLCPPQHVLHSPLVASSGDRPDRHQPFCCFRSWPLNS